MVKKKRILVVDDEQINLEFFEVMLSNLGFDVRQAHNGQEALEAVKKLRPDLILLDNIMPRLSGWEVTKILKSSPEYAEVSKIPIIMFSALDDVKDKVEGLEMGADDYITKPFNFAEVLARIRASLRTYELVRQVENREKRLEIEDRAVKDLVGTIAAVRKSIADIAGAPDLESVSRMSSELEKTLDALDLRLSSFKKEAIDLKLAAEELDAGKQSAHGAGS